MVCAVCTGTQNDQPLVKCKAQGHHLVPAQEAIKVILSQLKPLVENSITKLSNTMALRTSIKTRVESTIQSLAKFTDELKQKVIIHTRVLSCSLVNFIQIVILRRKLFLVDFKIRCGKLDITFNYLFI